MVSGYNGKWHCLKHGAFADIGTSIFTNLGTVQWPECPTCKTIAENNLCQECEKHPAAVEFSASVMDSIHGMTEHICRCCYVTRIESHLESVIQNLDRAKQDLIDNPCDPFEPDPL